MMSTDVDNLFADLELGDVALTHIDDWEELSRTLQRRQLGRTSGRREWSQQQLLAAARVYQSFFVPQTRIARPRLQWDIHLHYLLSECNGSFDRYYRMPLDAFIRLRTLLEPFLLTDSVMAYVSCQREPIDVTLVLHCVIRWLAGGDHNDIRIIGGISRASFYRALHAGLAALCLCPDLDYAFPYTREEINDAAAAWANLSSHRVVLGCVGAMDGVLVRIRAPSRRETGHVRSYFSGHYHCYGVLVLAVCDHMCRFTHLAVASPGGGSDINAFRNGHIRRLTDRLPMGRFVVADNAYICTDTVVTPFSGSDATDPVHDAFNYHVSQQRIRIEMAFGYMNTKWEILQKPLKVRLRNLGIVLNAISRVHNFGITHRRRGPHTSEINGIIHGRRGFPRGFLPTPSTVRHTESTAMRQQMVDYIDANGIRRPAQNIARRDTRSPCMPSVP
eukprot:GHVU01013600.1.p1 GENE.GHVU01013600.1~~GHVU01013600.1.p1  ORF type:complete len:446 (+),score=19.66 GHVU01013600.1:210-1547(+)